MSYKKASLRPQIESSHLWYPAADSLQPHHRTALRGKRSPLTNYRRRFTLGKHFPFCGDQSETANSSGSGPPPPSQLSKPLRTRAPRSRRPRLPRRPARPARNRVRGRCARAPLGGRRALAGRLSMQMVFPRSAVSSVPGS